MVVQNTMGLDNGDGTNAGRLLMVFLITCSLVDDLDQLTDNTML